MYFFQFYLIDFLLLQFCLSSIALFCIGAAFIAAIGICSLFGVPYGPVHNSLPFMLMGLGVDDVFVMAASWEQVLSEKINRVKPLQEKVALMLSHAGSAISITSLTDVVAFIIGTSTASLYYYYYYKLIFKKSILIP